MVYFYNIVIIIKYYSIIFYCNKKNSIFVDVLIKKNHTMKRIFLFLVLVSALVSCGNSGQKKEVMTETTGSPYELVLVCENYLYDGELGDTLKGVFLSPELMLNQPEPKFSIVHKRNAGFTGIFKYHRNIIMMEVDTTLSDDKKLQYGILHDQWAKPQVVVVLKAQSEEMLKNLFIQKSAEIYNYLEKAEQERFVSKLVRYSDENLVKQVAEAVSVNIKLPKNYKIRNVIKPDFVWLSYEMPISSQGLVIYTYPYEGNEFNAENLIAKRNEFVKRIPGQKEGTYMQTSDAFAPIVENVMIGERKWTKLSGFWNVYNDFMGGSYRNYTTIDEANNRVVSVDCYVYSPDGNKGQRNYIKQLEAVVKTVKL